MMERLPEILIVDDNTFNVYSLKLLIEEVFKLPTLSAYSGQEGINMLNNRISKGLKPFKLILTDINMPEMDGFEMSSKILEILSKKYQSNGGASEMQFVHIYAVTAMNESQIKDNHKQYGIKRF